MSARAAEEDWRVGPTRLRAQAAILLQQGRPDQAERRAGMALAALEQRGALHAGWTVREREWTEAIIRTAREAAAAASSPAAMEQQSPTIASPAPHVGS